MRILKLWVAALVLAMAVSGCGMSSYMTSNQNQNSTTVVLSENNFSIVGSVEASVSTTYFLGIGGIGKKELYSNVMAELSKKANLSGSQALINISTKVHVQNVILWSTYTVEAYGTIIEFHDKGEKLDKKVTVEKTNNVELKEIPVGTETNKSGDRFPDSLYR